MELKDLAFVLKELGIPFNPSYNTEEAFLKAITKRILENNDITSVTIKTLRILISYGFSLKYEDGKVFSLKDLAQ